MDPYSEPERVGAGVGATEGAALALGAADAGADAGAVGALVALPPQAPTTSANVAIVAAR
jgi:hypothetical protein